MTPAVTLNGKKVLIVEDNFLIAQDLGDVMRGAGCWVCGVVPSSAAALRHLREERPDGVLLDVGLADSDASPVAQALASRGVPFLLVTACEPDDLPPALRGRPCLAKPFSAATLVAMASRAFAN
jgi:Response regulator containing CheY-like receiver, AAA-type ATPase, and DNA-binding domains